MHNFGDIWADFIRTFDVISCLLTLVHFEQFFFIFFDRPAGVISLINYDLKDQIIE